MLFGNDHWQSIDSRLALGQIDRIERLAAEKKKRLEYVTELRDAALLAASLGFFSDASEDLRRAQEIQVELMGADDPDSLDLIADLATSLSLEDRNAAVEAVTADALAQNQRVRGPRHPSTVVAMARLARVRESRGELCAAKEILAKASPAKRPASAETQGSSIRLRYHANGQLASWAPGTQDTFGVVPPPGDQHDVDRDIAAVRTLSEAERTILGSSDPGRLESLEWIAKRHLERHQFDGATEGRREIVAFFVEQAGPDHWRTIDARANLAAIERMAVVATQAPDLLSSAEHAEQQVQIDQASGGVGGRQGASELQHTLSALVLWRKVLGERAQRCVQYLENMGTILRRQGQLDAAERVLTRVVHLRHDTLGERHPAFAQAIRELGVVLVEKGRAAEAERMLRGAVDRFGAELGKHHAVTAVTAPRAGQGAYPSRRPAGGSVGVPGCAVRPPSNDRRTASRLHVGGRRARDSPAGSRAITRGPWPFSRRSRKTFVRLIFTQQLTIRFRGVPLTSPAC